jgi:mannose-6-phosphate isomerase-like protein (cupin superfamily)
MGAHEIGDFQPVPNRPGRLARELMANVHEFERMFLTETIMEAGSSIPLHIHSVEEGWVVLEGELSFRLGDELLKAGKDTTVYVPAGLAHAVLNAGSVPARALTAAPTARDRFYREATHYLEGVARVD